ncbi:hypothetical protein GCM10007880_67200 [Mesorhizobium amorphae]|nr:hypothetical protein GCM10007880_67200 [Mesorhizobium amorphae]
MGTWGHFRRRSLSTLSSPPFIIAHAVSLYLRFPLSLRMVEDMLVARGIIVTHHSPPWPSSRCINH